MERYYADGLGRRRLMKSGSRTTKFLTYGSYVLAALLAIVTVVFLEFSFGADAAENESPGVIYSHGTLRATIPYHGLHAGAGSLTVEVLSPEDEVLGRAEQATGAAEGAGHWQQTLTLTKPLAVEDLAWQRLRYRFTYDDEKHTAVEGTESISQILRMPVLHILGQQSYLAGGEAAVRIIVTDSRNDIIAGGGTVRIELSTPAQKNRVLFTGRLNRRGTTEAQFHFPQALAGSYPLRYVVDTPIGSTEYTEQVNLADKVSILLTTEKPIYQPGQMIHARALALDRSNHEAAAGRKVTFEVEDSRGNKVFKKVTQTDKFGIASGEFALAEEVNLGTYHLRALMDEPEAPSGNRAEMALNV